MSNVIASIADDRPEVMVVNGLQFDDQWVPISEALALTLKGVGVLYGDGDVLMLLLEDQ